MQQASNRRLSVSNLIMPVLAIVLAIAAIGVDVGMSVAAGDTAHSAEHRQAMGP